MKKIIFLDNDGVICLPNNWESRKKKLLKWRRENNIAYNEFIDNSKVPVNVRFDNFDKKAIKILNQILEETGADIVVSSDWRHHATLEELGDYYEEQGIIKRPISVTESFGVIKNEFVPKDFEFDFSRELEMERYFEISKWLKDNTDVTHWVAIDDLNLSTIDKDYRGETKRNWGLENFVHLTRAYEGIKQSGAKEKILKFLK